MIKVKETKSLLLTYKSSDGATRLEVRFERGTVWLSQRQMTDLFKTTKQNISLRIRDVFAKLEPERVASVKEYLTVQTEGTRQVGRQVTHQSPSLL